MDSLDLELIIQIYEMSSIGPQLPPHLQHLASNNGDDDSDEEAATSGPQLPPGHGASKVEDEQEDEKESVGPQPTVIGPSIPSHLMKSTTPPPPSHSRVSQPQGPDAGSSSKRVVGPTLPSYGPTYNASTFNNIEDDDDSDEDVGPKPLPSGMRHEESDAVKEFLDREERMRKAREVRSISWYIFH